MKEGEFMKSKRVLGVLLAASVAFSNCNVLWAETAEDSVGVEAYDDSNESSESGDVFIPQEKASAGDVLLDGDKINIEAMQYLYFTTGIDATVNDIKYTNYMCTSGVNTKLTINGVTGKYRVAFKITAEQDAVVNIDYRVNSGRTNYILKGDVTDGGTAEVVASQKNDGNSAAYTTLSVELKAGDVVYFAGNETDSYVYSVYTNKDDVAKFTDFKFNASTGEITDYTGTDKDITIPEKINGHTVTGIADNAFNWNSSITSITLPSTITSIGESAFYGCYNLTSVTINGSVETIGDSAFRNCYALKDFTISGSVKSIGTNAFNYCYKLTSFDVSGSVGTIGDEAFYECSALTSFNASDSVETIGANAFYNCSSLKNITNTDSLKSIGTGAFLRCSALTGFNISNTVETIGENAFGKCGSLKNITVAKRNSNYKSVNGGLLTKDGKEFIILPAKSGITDYTVPDSVEKIDDYAFYSCSNLESVTIGDGIDKIGDYTFYECSALTTVNNATGIVSVGNYAFYNCGKLSTLNTSAGVTSDGFIGNYAFCYCYKLTEINIAEGVTSIGGSAFECCHELKNVNIPDSVTSIGDEAFSDCSSMTSINIPDSVESIGRCAFYYCSGLTSITVPASVKTIGEYAFYNTSITTVYCVKSSAADDVDLYPSGVTFVYVYDENAYTDESLFTFSDGVITKYKGADIYVNIPPTIGDVAVTGIGSNAFYGKTSIEEIRIPDSVTDIAYDAFENCTELKKIGVSENNTAYKSVDGILFNYEGTELVHYPSNIEATEYTVPAGVKTIDGLAFEACVNLTSIKLPTKLETIGEYAFYGCDGLTSIEIPYTVTSIADDVFEECSKLETVYCYEGSAADDSTLYPDGVEIVYLGDMPDYAPEPTPEEYFEVEGGIITAYNGSDTDVIILETINGDKVTELDALSFAGTDVTSVKIPNGVIKIGSNAFKGCTSLKKVIIPSSIATVMSTSFSGCEGLEKVYCYKGTKADDSSKYPSKPKIIYIGNVNNDDAVDEADAALIIKFVNGTESMSTVDKTIRDYNMDGVFNILDTIGLLKDMNK